ncbi:MAG: Hsp33 family molecular chaperone HslO [Burkholderiales bacterium]|nr:Hsp33 family molecular chaperone HslO [Burkholderiales bacterium]
MRVFAPRLVSFRCSCTRERVAAMPRMLCRTNQARHCRQGGVNWFSGSAATRSIKNICFKSIS